MRVGERGQVTIPKEIREKFGIGPNVDVKFDIVGGSIVLRKVSGKSRIGKWRGRCKEAFSELGYTSVDRFIEDIRGR